MTASVVSGSLEEPIGCIFCGYECMDHMYCRRGAIIYYEGCVVKTMYTSICVFEGCVRKTCVFEEIDFTVINNILVILI